MDEAKEVKLSHFDSLSSGEAIIVHIKDGKIMLHQWTDGGVFPAVEYQSKRKAASRVLQLLGIGPVAPQTHPERAMIAAAGEQG